MRMAPAARLLTLGLILLAAAAGRAEACTRLTNDATLRTQLLAAVNGQRQSAGLARLAADPRLEEAAFLIVCDNATRDRLSHTAADGSTLDGRARRVGYAWRVLNENLAQSNGSPAQVVQLWMSSRPHRANLLAASTRHFGGAAARSRSGRLYWAMVSAQPR